MSTDIGDRMKEAFGGLDMKSAMRITFNKCPECGVKMIRGSWLRWCPDRSCQRYIGVLNKALGNQIDVVKPRTALETQQLARLAEDLGVSTS